MNSVFFENIHTAASDFPYVDYNMSDINYLSHIHEEIEIVYIVSGSVEIVCETSEFTAKEGDICIFMPGEIHSFTSIGPNKLYIVKLQCKNSEENFDFSEQRIMNPLNSTASVYDVISEKITRLVYEAKAKSLGYAFAVNSIVQELLCTIIRSEVLIKIASENRKRHHFYLEFLKKVNDYISKHFTERITLHDISAFCNLSEYYFVHIFKAVTGTTFFNYLTAYRLDHSIPLLLYSDKKITEIASLCGFSNTRSFNRAFKSVFAKTPTEYIAQNK